MGTTLNEESIERFHEEASRVIHKILDNSQSSLKTIDQFLGKGAEVVKAGKRILDSVDETLNKGYTLIIDKVFRGVKDKLTGPLSLQDEELKEKCRESSKTVMKRKVKSVFGVTSQQLAVGLATSVVILACLFIFFGVQVFRGQGAAVAIINTGLVAVGGALTSLGNSKSGSNIFTNISPKIRAFLSSNLDRLLDAALTTEIVDHVVIGLMKDDNTLKEIVSGGA